MGPEAASNSSAEAIQAEIRAEMEQMGGEVAIREQIGIGVEELSRHIEYGGYSGTLWDATKRAFSDPEDPCPVGKGLMKSYDRGGIDEVEKNLNGLAMMAEPGFDSSIAGQTREVEIQRQLQPETKAESPRPPDDIDPPPPTEGVKIQPQIRAPEEVPADYDVPEQTEIVNRQVGPAIIAITQLAEQQSPGVVASDTEPTTETHTEMEVKVLSTTPLERNTETITAAPITQEITPETVKSTHVEEVQKLIITDAGQAEPVPATKKVIDETPMTAPIAPRNISTDPVTEAKSVVQVNPEQPTQYSLPVIPPHHEMTEIEQPESADTPIQVMPEEPAIEALPERSSFVVQRVAEIVSLEDRQIEQTETIVTKMPEEVQDALITYFEQAEPEQSEAAAGLVVKMAVVAERLQVLAEAGELEGREAVEIKEALAVWYEELMTQLEIEVDEETVATFIEKICHQTYGRPELVETVIHWEQGTRERKVEDDSPQQGDIIDAIRQALGRLTLSREAIA